MRIATIDDRRREADHRLFFQPTTIPDTTVVPDTPSTSKTTFADVPARQEHVTAVGQTPPSRAASALGSPVPPGTFRPPEDQGVDDKSTKSSRLVERVREAILSGEFRPGTKINLDNLRREFGVSLSPLREGLARLISVGLVELHENRGYTVAPVSLANLAEITRLRVEFESLALATAIDLADVNWESEVMRCLHRLNRSVRDPADPRTLLAWEHAHREFHASLLAGCGMPLLLNFCVVLHNLNDRYRRVFLVQSGGDRNVVNEHSEIAQGAVARDKAYACDKLREHITRTGNNLRAQLTEGRQLER